MNTLKRYILLLSQLIVFFNWVHSVIYASRVVLHANCRFSTQVNYISSNIDSKIYRKLWDIAEWYGMIKAYIMHFYLIVVDQEC